MQQNENLKKAKIINGSYAGTVGVSTDINKYGNVMFYPNNSKPVYRVCKSAKEVEFINE